MLNCHGRQLTSFLLDASSITKSSRLSIALCKYASLNFLGEITIPSSIATRGKITTIAPLSIDIDSYYILNNRSLTAVNCEKASYFKK